MDGLLVHSVYVARSGELPGQCMPHCTHPSIPNLPRGLAQTQRSPRAGSKGGVLLLQATTPRHQKFVRMITYSDSEISYTGVEGFIGIDRMYQVADTDKETRSQ